MHYLILGQRYVNQFSACVGVAQIIIYWVHFRNTWCDHFKFYTNWLLCEVIPTPDAVALLGPELFVQSDLWPLPSTNTVQQPFTRYFLLLGSRRRMWKKIPVDPQHFVTQLYLCSSTRSKSPQLYFFFIAKLSLNLSDHLSHFNHMHSNLNYIL